MNTKPSKITLKKQEISPHSPSLGFRDNYLLADYFTLISLRNLGKFLWNFPKCSNQSLACVHTPSLNKTRRGGGGGMYTGCQSSASKGYNVTDVTGK